MVGFCFLSPRGVVVSYFLVYFKILILNMLLLLLPHVCTVLINLEKATDLCANSSGW